MSAKTAPAPATDAVPARAGGKKKLILMAVPLLLVLAGGGAWFSGRLPFGHKPAAPATPLVSSSVAAPVFADMPDIVANLNATPRRQSYIKLKVKLELARPEDQAAIAAAMPRLLDMFQTYLREMRPEELRGSAGTYRLREELIARANIAASPAQVVDVLFTDMLIQ